MTFTHPAAASVGGSASSTAYSSKVVGALAADAIVCAPRIPEMATFDMLNQLPKLDDHEIVGKQMRHVVPRDNEPDLKFDGILLAAVAPMHATRDRWREYRVYKTASGKHVFSKVGRSIVPGERDKFEAEVFDPEAKKWDASRTWQKDVQNYFEHDDLAKKLYAELGMDTAIEI